MQESICHGCKRFIGFKAEGAGGPTTVPPAPGRRGRNPEWKPEPERTPASIHRRTTSHGSCKSVPAWCGCWFGSAVVSWRTEPTGEPDRRPVQNTHQPAEPQRRSGVITPRVGSAPRCHPSSSQKHTRSLPQDTNYPPRVTSLSQSSGTTCAERRTFRYIFSPPWKTSVVTTFDSSLRRGGGWEFKQSFLKYEICAGFVIKHVLLEGSQSRRGREKIYFCSGW